MKLGILIILGLVAGAFGAHFLMQDVGYVLINMRGYAVEMSVPGLILALAAVYLAVRIVIRLIRAPRKLGQAAGAYRSRRARKQYTRGLIAVAEGNSARGERLLTRGARRSETPLLNYLAAARAAQAQGADERRDNWLLMAREEEPEAEVAVILTQSELQIERGQYEPAIRALTRIGEAAPNHGRRLLLLARAYRATGDWTGLRDILPRLIKSKAMPAEDLEALQREMCTALMDQAASDGDAARVDEIWNALPKPIRANPRVFSTYSRAAARCGGHDKLEKVVRKVLKTTWDPSLVEIYGELETSRPAAHLAHLEAWLARRGDDPVLLLAAARLCIQNQLWGKARSYLENSLALRAEADGYRVYGQLLEKMGEPDAAAEAFRLGLEAATVRAAVPALSAPATPGTRS